MSLLDIAEGAEASRRAAWAQFYDMKRRAEAAEAAVERLRPTADRLHHIDAVVSVLFRDLGVLNEDYELQSEPERPFGGSVEHEVWLTARHLVGEGFIAPSWPHRTKECAAVLDELDVPLDVSTRACLSSLRSAGHGFKPSVVAAAVRFRRRSVTQIVLPDTTAEGQSW